ncbi:MAG: Fic family protein [Gammaproteobacteria bacterium]|nr:Fic family protein [Gammaproteobacteria bacterium]
MLENEFREIEAVVGRHPNGIGVQGIARELDAALPRRTLQYRLGRLVENKRLIRQGHGRATRYQLRQIDLRVHAQAGPPKVDVRLEVVPGDLYRLRGELRQRYLLQPANQRPPVGYRREFLDNYVPNVSAYLSAEERTRLRGMGQFAETPEPAGTHARRIIDRMLIDLSWNSSRLEGNTYSLLDTKRLIELGDPAEGPDIRETQMILNHKHAIEFLVESVNDVRFDRRTILNLHATLAENLLPDPAAPGRLRSRPVGIGASAYRPLEVPAQVEECFDQVLASAQAIGDPFEQALFCLVQIPYLQAFDDVNKRVSRLAANIPLIKNNLSPLSFSDVPRDYYSDAVLLVYEQNDTHLLKNLFLWAYERSAGRYGAIRQSVGEPDPFRLRHREALRELVGEVVRNRLDVGSAATRVAAWVAANVEAGDRDRFHEMAETELLGLHEGNYARYRVSAGEFDAWWEVWDAANRG